MTDHQKVAYLVAVGEQDMAARELSRPDGDAIQSIIDTASGRNDLSAEAIRQLMERYP